MSRNRWMVVLVLGGALFASTWILRTASIDNSLPVRLLAGDGSSSPESPHVRQAERVHLDDKGGRELIHSVANVSLLIVDDESSPVAGARVALSATAVGADAIEPVWPDPLLTDRRGCCNVAFDGASPMAVNVTVTADGFSPYSGRLELIDGASSTFQLVPLPVLRGRIMDRAGNHPSLAGVRVLAVPESSSASADPSAIAWPSGLTEADGRFSITPLSHDHNYTIFAMGEGLIGPEEGQAISLDGQSAVIEVRPCVARRLRFVNEQALPYARASGWQGKNATTVDERLKWLSRSASIFEAFAAAGHWEKASMGEADFMLTGDSLDGADLTLEHGTQVVGAGFVYMSFELMPIALPHPDLHERAIEVETNEPRFAFTIRVVDEGESFLESLPETIIVRVSEQVGTGDTHEFYAVFEAGSKLPIRAPELLGSGSRDWIVDWAGIGIRDRGVLTAPGERDTELQLKFNAAERDAYTGGMAIEFVDSSGAPRSCKYALVVTLQDVVDGRVPSPKSKQFSLMSSGDKFERDGLAAGTYLVEGVLDGEQYVREYIKVRGRRMLETLKVTRK